ncbi:hypothetical protein [Microbispora sp. NPDC049125]|uniref:hypothetical protein n=1 Tax=Microbispora sp. NPDC049125 TaxID=3154929 RepID=UPI003466BF35
MRLLSLIIVVGLLAGGSATFTPPARTVAEVAALVGDYLAAHPNVTRTVRSGQASVILVSDGTRSDLSADLGEGLSGRLIKTEDAAYFQMPLGEEVEAGKLFDKVTDYYESYNLAAIGMVMLLGSALVDGHRTEELIVESGRLTSATVDGGLARYTVAIDVARAVERLDLPAYVARRSYPPLTLEQEDEDRKIRAGDRDAQARFRRDLVQELGRSAVYELWVDRAGRPVRSVLAAKTRTERTFSRWGTSLVKAPPASQTRMHGP